MSLETSLYNISKKLISQFGIQGTLGSTSVNYVWSKLDFSEVANGDIKWTDKKIILDGFLSVDTDQLFTDSDGIVYTIIKASPSYIKSTRAITSVFLRLFLSSTTATVTLYSWADQSTDGYVDEVLTSLGTVTAAQAEVDAYDSKFVPSAELAKANAVFILDSALLTNVARAFVLFNGILYRELGRNAGRLICEAVDRTAYGV